MLRIFCIRIVYLTLSLDVVETYLFRPQISSGNPKNVFILFTAGSWREKHWSERPMRVIVGREFFVTHGIEGDNTMAGSVNKVILVGNLGADPEIRYMNNGRPEIGRASCRERV